jgi:Ricin-type beta-trefoil lectin domain
VQEREGTALDGRTGWHNPHPGKCLEVTGRHKLELYGCNNTSTEWYSFLGGEIIDLNQQLCLTTPAGGKLNGRALQVARCNGGIPERWWLR